MLKHNTPFFFRAKVFATAKSVLVGSTFLCEIAFSIPTLPNIYLFCSSEIWSPLNRLCIVVVKFITVSCNVYKIRVAVPHWSEFGQRDDELGKICKIFSRRWTLCSKSRTRRVVLSFWIVTWRYHYEFISVHAYGVQPRNLEEVDRRYQRDVHIPRESVSSERFNPWKRQSVER